MWNAISLLGAPPVATTATSLIGNETDSWTQSLIEALEGATPVGREVALEPNALENRLDSAPTEQDTEKVSVEPLVFLLPLPVPSPWGATLAEPQTSVQEARQISPAIVSSELPALTATLAGPQTSVHEARQVSTSSATLPVEQQATEIGTSANEAQVSPSSTTLPVEPQAAEIEASANDVRQVSPTRPESQNPEMPAFEVAFEANLLDPQAERQHVVKLMASEPEAVEVETVPTKSAAERDEAEPQTTLRAPVQSAVPSEQGTDTPRDQRRDSETRREQAIAQVKERLETLDLGRPQRVTIKLNPEELGQVVITLKRIGTSVETSIHAENPQTREALGQGKEALAGALEQRRFELTNFRVTNLRESEMFFGQFGQQHGAPQQRSHSRITPVSQPETRNGVCGVSPRPLARMGYVPKGVDLWI